MQNNLLDNKPLTDDYNTIRIGDLTKHPAFTGRVSAPWDTFRLAGKSVRLIHDRIERDWYIDIIDYSRHWPRSTINLVQTSCHYGSERHWFECPKCNRRVGVVYFGEKVIGCRTCLGLGYFTQRMNYDSLNPTFSRFIKAEKMDKQRSHRTYRGEPTRYAKRYYKLTSQIYGGLHTHEDELSLGEYTDMSDLTSLLTFVSTFAGHIAAEVARS